MEGRFVQRSRLKARFRNLLAYPGAGLVLVLRELNHALAGEAAASRNSAVFRDYFNGTIGSSREKIARMSDSADKPPPSSTGSPLPVSALAAPFVQAWLGLAAALLLIFAVGVLQLSRGYERITAEQQSRLQTQARVVAENILRQLQGVDSALRGIRADLTAASQAEADVSPQRLKELGRAMPGVRGIVVLDAKGTVVVSESSALTGLNFARRDYFNAPSLRPDYTSLYVSTPFTSTRNVYSINLGLAVPDARGQFAGVVSANLDPEYFEIVARSVLYAPDMQVSVIHGEGKAFIDAHHLSTAASRDLHARGSLFAEHMASEREETVADDKDMAGGGDGRMVVLRTVFPKDLDMDTPLVVSVSRSLDAVYAHWYDDALSDAVLFALLCASASGGLYFVQMRRLAAARAANERRLLSEQSAEQLRDAAELQRRTGRLAKVGGWQLELSSMKMTWTDEMYEIHDLDPRTPLSRASSLDQFVPEARRQVEEAMQAAIVRGTPWSIEASLVTPKGRHLWVRTQGEAIFEGEQVVRLVGASQDITERVHYAAELKAANEKLERLTVTDGLTGVGNRRLFDQKLAAEWARCARRGLHLGLLMLDIDHFKLYNDHYGHQAGDEILRRVADMLARCVQRSGELVARYGGEEFAVLLPGSDMESATTLAETFLAELAAAGMAHGASPTSPALTMSIGVASVLPQPAVSSERLVHSADNALYIAKHLGRNRAEQAPAFSG
jgi:diguanylate cyclase (GGDEF)-like protein